MANKHDEMRLMIEEARATFRAADRCANDIANILRGRLRSGDVSGFALTALKKELRDWNIHTGKWSDPK